MNTRLLKRQMTAAYQYSYTRLVLNDYTLYETISEQPNLKEDILSAAKTLNGLIGSYLAGEDILLPLRKLREDMTRKTEILASYTDCFINFEYVLNRMERRFYPMGESRYSDASLADTLAAFIVQALDAPMQQSRTRDILGQLPVRLTKQKFFSRVLEGLSVYIGSPKEGFRDFLYILKTESMVKRPEGMAEVFPDYEVFYQELMEADYKNLTKEEYERLYKDFQDVSAGIMEDSGNYIMVAEIVNDLMVLVLAKEDAVWDISEEELYRNILKTITKQYEAEDLPPMDASVEMLLAQLEGRQEAYYEKYMRGEIPQEDPDLRQDRDYIRMANVDRLISGSIFAEMLEEGTEDDHALEETACGQTESMVDRAYLEAEAGIYFDELGKLFEKMKKPVVRAVMARVLSELPVMFRSSEEISAYILGSLESCGDQLEKETCKELLEELIRDESNLV